MVWRHGPDSDATGARNDAVVAGPIEIARTDGPPIMTREVALYTWANTAGRHPEPAARALLFPSTGLGKRPAAVEILALGLANATSDLARKLEPLALLHKAPAGGRGNSERHGRHPVWADPVRDIAGQNLRSTTDFRNPGECPL